MDAVAFLFAAIGGFLVGTYPVLIKVPSVVEAKPHPVYFQCFKSLMVFLGGSLLILYLGPGVCTCIFCGQPLRSWNPNPEKFSQTLSEVEDRNPPS